MRRVGVKKRSVKKGEDRPRKHGAARILAVSLYRGHDSCSHVCQGAAGVSPCDITSAAANHKTAPLPSVRVLRGIKPRDDLKWGPSACPARLMKKETLANLGFDGARKNNDTTHSSSRGDQMGITPLARRGVPWRQPRFGTRVLR